MRGERCWKRRYRKWNSLVKQFKHPAVLVLNTKEPERPGNKECQKELNPGKIVRKNTTKLLFVLKLLFQIFAFNVSLKLIAM